MHDAQNNARFLVNAVSLLAITVSCCFLNFVLNGTRRADRIRGSQPCLNNSVTWGTFKILVPESLPASLETESLGVRPGHPHLKKSFLCDSGAQ